MPRKKAAYLGLMGLGIVAFIADRAFFAPSGAEASPPDAAVEETTPAAPRTEPADPVLAGKPLSSRLLQAAPGPWNASDVPDAFHPRGSWLAEAAMGPPVPDTPEAKSENTPREHKLSSTYLTKGQFHAIIDRKPYAVGDVLEDGLKVVAIDKDGVSLRGATGTVNLSLRSQP